MCVKLLKCGECNTEKSIRYVVVNSGFQITTVINKCTKCKYQYDIEELFALNKAREENND